MRFGQLSSYGATKKSTTNPMTDRTTDRPAGQTARNWFLIGCMAVGGDATLEQTKQFACYCPVLGSPNGLSLLVRLQHFVCAFSVCGGGERGDKEHNNSTAELHFYYFCQKKKRETPKKNDPSKPRNCIELS